MVDILYITRNIPSLSSLSRWIRNRSRFVASIQERVPFFFVVVVFGPTECANVYLHYSGNRDSVIEWGTVGWTLDFGGFVSRPKWNWGGENNLYKYNNGFSPHFNYWWGSVFLF